jgi:hypothetical protein
VDQAPGEAGVAVGVIGQAVVDHDCRARLAGARPSALGVQGEAVACGEREIRAVDVVGRGRVGGSATRRPGSAPA